MSDFEFEDAKVVDTMGETEEEFEDFEEDPEPVLAPPPLPAPVSSDSDPEPATFNGRRDT